ncbi:guanylate cyclase-related protein [Nonlabens ulvanivorans]|uniref:Guanylate cyclase-related protein n=1 Tax=Nonlabens ulvanivorans TaxID=906888 RepID=A0A081D7P3_NONUL|nr:heme NO-binding domain-containing protein [Nonlabens ulvanivorans]WOI22504.1 heme NO-binding domain-containing protein [Nonlabens ulvanivorans]GAK74939.1 guanylate cyclase-related protein [Nonlabens ulvanivorans]GAL74105.1 guanylate cyclase-related protein [Nonlabens ulvanivorans]
MKGIVFTEFLDLVEEKFGLGMVDQIIEQSELPSNGVYTSIGTYSFAEMLQLIQNLSANTGLSIDQLLLAYGEHFFNVIENSYPGLLATYKDPIEMLSSIENHIHIEVRKIYPDAELPTFEVLEKSDQHLVMIYKSSRAMHHFGLGLMNRTFAHFEMTSNIQIEKIKEDGTEVKFTIHKT